MTSGCFAAIIRQLAIREPGSPTEVDLATGKTPGRQAGVVAADLPVTVEPIGYRSRDQAAALTG